MTDMTVVELAAKHCASCEDADTSNMRDSIQAHVDTLITGALVYERSLWKVGVDSEGRASLIWVSLPEEVWEGLLKRSLAVAELRRALGGLL